MISILLLVGILMAVFVGFNIGGSSTGIAWGPAVGANVLSKTAAAAIMSVFFLIGGWTIGRNVIQTLGGRIVPQEEFTLVAGIAVLFFIGLGMLIANLFGVPVPTSMVATGAIAGLGAAVGALDWEVLGRIFMWWMMTPAIAFWIGMVVGRYLYPHLDTYFYLRQSRGPLLELDRSGMLPKPVKGPNTTTRELAGAGVIIAIGCYMSFSAGASNAANAVAPLVGGGELPESPAILIAAFAVALGGFTIARRTMESVGNELTELPLLGALIVAIVASTITTFLSWAGIPISLVMATVMTIVGLGWGRATRTTTALEYARGEGDVELSISALTDETPDEVPAMGEEKPSDIISERDLVNPRAIGRFVTMWIIGPTVAAGMSYFFFIYAPFI
ncbi:MAG: inorganic phosphate transporter [Halobacteriales archaeon]|nr:inorganic phosphate transporter [Halobacteriales archaeon]